MSCDDQEHATEDTILKEERKTLSHLFLRVAFVLNQTVAVVSTVEEIV